MALSKSLRREPIEAMHIRCRQRLDEHRLARILMMISRELGSVCLGLDESALSILPEPARSRQPETITKGNHIVMVDGAVIGTPAAA